MARLAALALAAALCAACAATSKPGFSTYAVGGVNLYAEAPYAESAVSGAFEAAAIYNTGCDFDVGLAAGHLGSAVLRGTDEPLGGQTYASVVLRYGGAIAPYVRMYTDLTPGVMFFSYSAAARRKIASELEVPLASIDTHSSGFGGGMGTGLSIEAHELLNVLLLVRAWLGYTTVRVDDREEEFLTGTITLYAGIEIRI